MRAPFRPLTDWERRMQRLRAWMASDEARLFALWLAVVAMNVWWFGLVTP